MASVSGVSSSNASSIYGNRNVISGLASGMDTESMIENAVSGIKKRISGLGQKRTKWEWKQESYRSIINKMVGFSNKYTSYNSSTNLFSASFFSKAVLTTANGSNASKVSATGKTSSDVRILGVDRLATAARATASGGVLGSSGGADPIIKADGSVDLSGSMDISNLSGSMTIGYGGKKVTIDFAELEVFDPTKPQELADAINKKLSDQKIITSSGDSVPASELIKVNVDSTTGEISFADKSSGGNSVFISDVTGKLKDTLGLGDLSAKDKKGFSVDGKTLSQSVPTGEYLSGKAMTFTMDGVTKKITLPTYDPSGTADDFAAGIQKELDKVFGGGKITVDNNASGNDLSLQFTVNQKGSTLLVSSPVGEKLGLGASASTYQDMGKTLGSLSGALDNMQGHKMEAVGAVTTDDKGVSKDANGNVVKKDSDDKYYLMNKEGTEFATGYDMTVNGVKIGTYTKDTALDKIVADINNNTEAGVNVSYSRTTGQYVFTAKEFGAAGRVDIAAAPDAASGKESNLAAQLFGTIDGSAAANRGTDAQLTMQVNGGAAMTVTRSTNTFDVDGLSVTLNGTFDSQAADGGDAITFTSKSDSDKIVTAIKDMVKDYNEMMKEIKDAYTTMPAQKANKSKYEPLTDADRADMSESAIKSYEEKAKQGILFADSDLSSLYNKMRSIFASSGADGAALRAMGISTEYSGTDGTTVILDEEKLRAMLDSNPDAVKDAFTKTQENGASTDGVMAKLKTQLDNYAGTTGATKGLLIEKAGSPLAPTSVLKNSMLDAMNNIDKEIERWETKLSDSVDRYTRQFSQLEQLIAQMNSQSSSLMSMMGGGG